MYHGYSDLVGPDVHVWTDDGAGGKVHSLSHHVFPEQSVLLLQYLSVQRSQSVGRKVLAWSGSDILTRLCWCCLRYLSDSRVFLRHQFVHVTVKHDVDVALQSDPDVVEFVVERVAGHHEQEGLVYLFLSLRRRPRLRSNTLHLNNPEGGGTPRSALGMQQYSVFNPYKTTLKDIKIWKAYCYHASLVGSPPRPEVSPRRSEPEAS